MAYPHRNIKYLTVRASTRQQGDHKETTTLFKYGIVNSFIMANAALHSSSHLQLKVGFAFLCLGTLILHTVIRSMPSYTETPTISLHENFAKYDVQAIQESIDELSKALHNFHVNIAPLCSDNSSAIRDLPLLIIAGFAVVIIWMLGMLILLIGLHQISVAYEQRVVLFGVAAANCSLVLMIFWMPHLQWYMGLLYVCWSSLAGMILGVVSGDQGGEMVGEERKD